jgi:hypothetical protein
MHDVWSPSVNADDGRARARLPGAVRGGSGRAAGRDDPGAVVAAAFGVFEPGVIGGLWDAGRAKLAPKDMVALRRPGRGGEPPRDDRVRRVGGRPSSRWRRCWSGRSTPSTARAGRCSRRCRPSRAWPTPTAGSGGPRTPCASTAATRTCACVRRGRARPGADGILSEVWVGFPVGRVQRHAGVAEDVQRPPRTAWWPTGLIADGRSPPEGTAVPRRVEAGHRPATGRPPRGRWATTSASVVEQTERWSQLCVEGRRVPAGHPQAGRGLNLSPVLAHPAVQHRPS